MLPTAIAPMYAALPRCPMMATSTIPSSGTVMFDTIEGMAMLSISLSRGFIFILLSWLAQFRCLLPHRVIEAGLDS